MSTNGSLGTSEQYTAAESSRSDSSLTKDEVGWYFVEQYYTTLSRSPEKLHLFHNQKSAFVYGPEAEIAPVSVGREAIGKRIKEIGFQDTKVRVSNVDCQGSFDNIVVQVIGELSNKNADLKKFCQTFVLAPQSTGYFVLNDIFRTINEDVDEEVEAPVAEEPAQEAEATAPEPEATPAAEEVKEEPIDAAKVDEKLEAEAEEAPAAVKAQEEASVNGKEEKVEEAAPVEEAEAAPSPAAVEKALEEETAQPEKPQDPSPTPAEKEAGTSKPLAAAPAAAPAPAAPAKPMSWASRAAAAAGTPRPVVPITKAATPAPAKAAAAAAAAAPAAASKPAATPAAAAPTTPEADKSGANAGWQTAGENSKRQNRPQSISGPAPEKEGTLGYVRHVTDNVKPEDLRAVLASFGQLVYFDVNRSKNCAFVEFAEPAGYQAAVAANPHHIGGEAIVVEPRRPKAAAYGGGSFSGGRGGASSRGRGGFEQGRSGSQSGRGNFAPNRGRGSVRGRGGSQVANA